MYLHHDSQSSRTKVLLVDDHPVTREGVISLIRRQSDLAVCGHAESVLGALAAVADVHPDLVLIEVVLAAGSGIQLVRRLRTEYPDVKTMMLSSHDEAFYAERALQAGARGYVSKRDACDQILQGIRQVLAGGIFLGKTLADKMLRDGHPEPDAAAGPSVSGLSDREFEIFEMIGRAKSPKHIAQRLNISIKTVSAHREKIKRKLGLESAAEVLAMAIHWVQYGGRRP